MSTQQYGPFDDAAPAVIALGLSENQEWHEITVSVFNAAGDPALTGVTGTLSGEVLKRGADRFEAFTQALDLAADQRAWDPELSRAQQFRLTVAGLNTGFTYRVTVNSWEG